MTRVNRGLFTSLRTNWKTPKALYPTLNAEFGFDCDPCPIHPKVDGLEGVWEWDWVETRGSLKRSRMNSLTKNTNIGETLRQIMENISGIFCLSLEYFAPQMDLTINQQRRENPLQS